MELVALPVYSWGCAAGHAIRMALAHHRPPRGAGAGAAMRPRAARGDPQLLRAARDGQPHRGGARSTTTRRPACSTSPTSRRKLSTRTAAVYVETPSYLGADRGRGAEIAGSRTATAPSRSSASTRSRSACWTPPADYGADIVVGTDAAARRPHELRRRRRRLHRHPRRGALRARVPDAEHQHHRTTAARASSASASACSHQTSYGMREQGKDWTGNSVYLWAIANAVYMALLGPAGLRARSAS